MEDENAFGILVAFSNVEDEEYATDDLSAFADRFTLFARLVLQQVQAHPLAPAVRGLNLGHAVYLEFADDETHTSLLPWIKALRTELSNNHFASTVIASHGGRWVSESGQATISLEAYGGAASEAEAAASEAEAAAPKAAAPEAAAPEAAAPEATAPEAAAPKAAASEAAASEAAASEAAESGRVRLASFAGPSEPLRRALYAETRTHATGDEEDGWGPGFYLDIEAMEALGIRPKNEPTYLDVASARFVRVSR